MNGRISAIARKYLTDDPTIDREHQKQYITALEDLSKKIMKNLDDCRKEKQNEYPDKTAVDFKSRQSFIATTHFLAKVTKRLKHYEMNAWDEFLKISSEMLLIMRENQHCICAIASFDKDMNRQISTNSKYHSLRFQSKSLNAKMNRLLNRHPKVNYINALRVELLNCASKFNTDINYSPPSNLDRILGDFILTSPLAKMVAPTASIISKASVESAIFTIDEFTKQLYDLLSINSDPARSIIYTSLVRFLFDEAYPKGTDLSCYSEANIRFLIACDKYSTQPVRDLQLSDFITKGYTLGLPVPSLFKSKQVSMLKQMENMTNPIDLMYHVHTILNSLAQYFAPSEGFLSFDDILTLILALMAISPPSNAVAIAKFIDKWADIVLSDIVGIAKNYFIAAVDHLVPLKDVPDAVFS